MLYMNIEEIVKFQQELLKQQKNQKEIQKETIKLVSLLNKSINYMSDRLDEFTEKTKFHVNDDKNNEQQYELNLTSSTSTHVSNLLDTSLKLIESINTTINNNSTASSNATAPSAAINTTATTTTDTSSDMSDSNDCASDDEKETIQIKKKPRISGSKDKDNEENNQTQRLFNKYVREKVEEKLGKEFLLTHEIQEIDTDIMEEIKNDALTVYPPVNIRPRRAWHLAKASLRCRRRSLRRKKEKQIVVTSSSLSSSSSAAAAAAVAVTAVVANQQNYEDLINI